MPSALIAEQKLVSPFSPIVSPMLYSAANSRFLGLAASREAMSEARLPLAYRDSCAHLLIPLNKCRRKEYYLPWKCEVLMPNFNAGQGVEFVKAKRHRMSGTAMRNANLRNIRSVLSNKTRSESLRVARGATEGAIDTEGDGNPRLYNVHTIINCTMKHSKNAIMLNPGRVLTLGYCYHGLPAIFYHYH
jgi:hypothetical protein